MRPQAVAYVALAVTDTLLSRHDEASKLRLATKPLLMPLLVSGVGTAHDDGPNATSLPWLRAGLALSGVGDIALLRSSQRAFTVGLSAFLSAHVCYARAFAAAGSLTRLRRYPKSVAAAYAAIGAVVAALAREAPGMRGPVIVYGSSIASMAVLGFGTGRPLVKVGALAFLASDLVLAIDHFAGDKVRTPRGFVMATYTLAQGLIALGLVRPDKPEDAG